MGTRLTFIISMMISGTLAIFVKNIPLSSGETALFRGVIASISIIAYQLITGNRIKFSEIKNDLFLLFLSGAVTGFAWILLFEAYSHTTVSLATLSYYFCLLYTSDAADE